MVNFARLVNQQLAYAEFHLGAPNIGANHLADPFARRCQQRAAELQLSLGINAYCGEVLERAGSTAYQLHISVGPHLFVDADNLLRSQHKHSSDLDELVMLSQSSQWLGMVLLSLEQSVTQEVKASLSPMLSRTTLTEAQNDFGLIASNRPIIEPPASIDWLTSIATLKALIQRQRDNKAEY